MNLMPKMLFPTDSTLVSYAVLRGQLKKQGTPIPHEDIWIAALAVEFNLTLYTRDELFRHLSQLSRL